jgi:tyrosyl-tRNA synthetase
MQLIADLKARGLIQDIMPGTEEQLQKEMTAGYIGFDPTADSLHVGSLLPITLLMRLQRAGHKPIALVGGATGMIGDPTGKSAERNMLDMDTLQKNCDGIRKQLEKFLDFDETKPNAAEMVNNYDWLKDYTFLDFIRDIGKHITVNYMLSKDSVQKRMEHGLSFTEFTYQLIQGFDFYYLNKTKNVKLQMGGADQWGNIVTGTELIRRKGRSEGFAFTGPLITKSDGSKFGKSEGGNIWLDPALTSPFQFYQFWIKLPDADAERMAYTFSFKEVSEIEALINQHREATHLRLLQKALADELTILVHSEADLEFAKKASGILFGNSAVEDLLALNENQLMEVMEGVPTVNASKTILTTAFDLVSFLAESGIYKSKGDAKKAVLANAFSINKEKVKGTDHKITTEQLLHNKYLLTQTGKSNYILVVFE